MSEFITHEVQVASVDCGKCDKAYHLVQCDSACNSHVAVAFGHVPVHRGVDQAEYYGLVTYKSLVVALDIGDCFLVGPAVGEFPEYGCGMPVLVFIQ